MNKEPEENDDFGQISTEAILDQDCSISAKEIGSETESKEIPTEKGEISIKNSENLVIFENQSSNLLETNLDDEETLPVLPKDKLVGLVINPDEQMDTNPDFSSLETEIPKPEKKSIDIDISATEAVLTSSLALIADYGLTSDSESDSESSSSSSSSSDTEDAVKIVNTGYRNAVTVISSGEDSSGSDREDDDDNRSRMNKTPNAQRIHRQKIKAKGELDVCDLPPIEDLNISVPETVCIELGRVMSIVDQLVLVESKPGTVALDLDTVLFLDHGSRTLGRIFDVLGQINQPIYCVRFNSAQQIQEKTIEVGQKVFYDHRPENTSVVVLPNLMRQKGSDASWEHDVEPPAGCLDFSDDEEERNIRKAKKNTRQVNAADPRSNRLKRTAPQNNGNYQQRVRNPYFNHQRQQQQHSHPGNMGNPNYSWHTYYQQQERGINPYHHPPGPFYMNPYAQPMINPMIFQQPPPPPPHHPNQHYNDQFKQEKP